MKQHVLFFICGVGLLGFGQAPTRLITGETNEPLEQRLQAVANLALPPSDADLQQLLAYLEHPLAPEITGNHSELTLKNDLLVVLHHPKVPPEPIVEVLLRCLTDESRNGVWRDYCVQHLGHFLPRLKEDLREKGVNALWATANETGDAISGTALLALHAQTNLTQEEINKLAGLAYKLAADPEQPIATRSTALQIASERNHARVSQLSRTILKNERSLHIRLSAIGVLGAHGTESDLPFLNAMEHNPLPPLRIAANLSADKISTRLNLEGIEE